MGVFEGGGAEKINPQQHDDKEARQRRQEQHKHYKGFFLWFHARRVFILYRIFNAPRAPSVGGSLSGFHFWVSFRCFISAFNFGVRILGFISGFHFLVSFLDLISGFHFGISFRGCISGFHFWVSVRCIISVFHFWISCRGFVSGFHFGGSGLWFQFGVSCLGFTSVPHSTHIRRTSDAHPTQILP